MQGMNYQLDIKKNNIKLLDNFQRSDFTSHTQTTLVLNTHWQAEVGYEFADWVKSSLGRAREQTQNSGFALNHLYTNGFLFNLTHIT